jgi:hypothetical protein
MAVKKKEEERTDIVIEGNTATWEIRLDGDINGTYMGQFRFKCFLSPTQKLAASREYRQLLGENPTLALTHEDNLAYALSQLKHRVISAPPFWTSTAQQSGMSGDIPDENVIMAVLDAAIGSELKYMTHLKKKKEEAIGRAKKAAERIIEQRDEENASEGESDEASG